MTNLSQHLSRDLKEWIKNIGETKSKQEQDRIIQQQVLSLKPKLSEKSIATKVLKEYLIRAMYIEMLGHSASFAHIHAVNLTQNKNLILKRIGYLMCTLFLTSQSELLIMLVSTVLKDLASTDVHDVVICLTSLCNLMNCTLAEAVQESVLKLLTHNTDIVRKKAILVVQKIKQVRKIDLPDYKDKMKDALLDREPSVMAASLNLYIEEARENPRRYRDLAGSFVVILQQIIQHKLSKDFDYHRAPAPWLQIKLLKILQLIGKGDHKASDHMYVIVEQTLKRAEETGNNIALAVAYQAIRTIAFIYPKESLAREAALVLTKYLEPRSSHNMKYVGIRALAHLHRDSPTLLEQFQLTIVDCLQNKDETLKRETLTLLFRMATKNNVEVIVAKMLNSLHGSTDDHFRGELVLKITELAENFSITHAWYIETMQLLFQLASQKLSDSIMTNFLRLVIEKHSQDPSFAVHILKQMLQLLDKVVPTDFILKTTSYIIGQIGSCSVESNQLNAFSKVLIKGLDDYTEETHKKYSIDALVKISSNPAFSNHSEVKLILEKYSRHTDLELAHRCLESKKLAKYNAALKQSLNIAFDEKLTFLQPYVDNYIKNGGKSYNRIKATEVIQKGLKFSFEPKITANLFSPNEKKEEDFKHFPPIKPQLHFQKIVEATKKPLVTPEQRQKMNLAKNLFGPPQKASKPAPLGKTVQQTKKPQKQESNDLI